jgi:hypothetical protein
MKKVLNHLPDWTIELREVSMGAYQVVATHVTGCRIVEKGPDLDKLMGVWLLTLKK